MHFTDAEYFRYQGPVCLDPRVGFMGAGLQDPVCPTGGNFTPFRLMPGRKQYGVCLFLWTLVTVFSQLAH